MSKQATRRCSLWWRMTTSRTSGLARLHQPQVPCELGYAGRSSVLRRAEAFVHRLTCVLVHVRFSSLLKFVSESLARSSAATRGVHTIMPKSLVSRCWQTQLSTEAIRFCTVCFSVCCSSAMVSSSDTESSWCRNLAASQMISNEPLGEHMNNDLN